MNLHRRQFLQIIAGAAALPTASRGVCAETYPVRPVRLIVGAAAGSAPDILARLMGEWLSERLGQRFVVENRPGGGTNIGTEAVVKAPADGHTLLLVAPASAINATLYDRLGFNFIRDIAPVATMTREPLVMLVNPSVTAKTIPEFIAYAKGNPGKVNMASPGIGTISHIAGELFNVMTGVSMAHVPYRGGAPALTDLMAGQVQVMFIPLLGSTKYISAGTLRALAVTSATRWQALPDIPTVAEFLPDYEATAWFGVGAPKSTPAGIVDRLNQDINAGLADPTIKARLTQLGTSAVAGSPRDFSKLIAAETEKWGKLIRAANIKPE